MHVFFINLAIYLPTTFPCFFPRYFPCQSVQA